MIVLDPVALLDAWELPVSRALRPAAFGLDNRTYFVETPAGVYVLRVYQNTGDVARVRYEHAVLERLRRVPPSFSVPVPLPARSGDTLARLAGPERELLAALFPLTPDGGPSRAASRRPERPARRSASSTRPSASSTTCGLAAERDVLARAAAALQLDAWLALHADAFVSRARSPGFARARAALARRTPRASRARTGTRRAARRTRRRPRRSGAIARR